VCGICGIVNRDRQEPVDETLLEAMTAALAHRGPDGAGIHVDRSVGLGHRRLAIVDPSPAARQPMANEEGVLWLVCNGEIYNHLALRRELEARGHRFRSRSDSEVVLHLYEELGEACVDRLRGMFAFALWDGTRDRLILARDRLGQKPLYYAETSRRVLFASEIKGLLEANDLDRSVRLSAIDLFLSLGYVPGPDTAFRGVRRLPPGTLAVVEGGTVRERSFWSLPLPPESGEPARLDRAEVEHELLHRLREAVRLRLMSDRPLGAFLSGGIDSGLVVALMREFSPGPVSTFSVAFTERDLDESRFSRRIAQALGTTHEEHLFTADHAAALPEVVRMLDQPFGDPSILPTEYLSRMATRRVKVVLNGDGGDESFFGYDRYVKQRVARLCSGIPVFLRRGAAAALSRAVPGRLPGSSLSKRLAGFLRFESTSEAELYSRWIVFFDRAARSKLYSPELCAVVGGGGAEALVLHEMARRGGRSEVERALRTDIATYLPDDLLVKMDMATMAHGLEARSPFLDHEFMEYVAGLPVALRLRGLRRKWILKKVAAPMLPREIVDRPKRGFGIPVAKWLRGELKELLCDTLSSQRARQRGYFEQARVEELISQHLSGREDWQFQLWNLLVLELWHRGVVDEPADGLRAAPPEGQREAGPGSGHAGGAGLHAPET